MIYFFILIFAQVVLETFPVSSSGQIALLESFFHLIKRDVCFSISSNRVISHFLHGPTVFVIALFFFNRWFFLLSHIGRCWKIILKLSVFVFLADVITFFFYLFFNSCWSKSLFPVGLGFAISAIALLSLRFCQKEQRGKITLAKALLLGVVQGIALLPGISRFGLTFVVARWIGVSSRRSFEFSFAIQWPLIAASFLNSLRFMFGPYLCAYMNLFSLDVLTFLAMASVISFFTLGLVQRIIFEKKMWIFSLFLTGSFIAWIFIQFLY